MPSKQSIIETLYFGLMDYVPKKKLVDYKNEFSSRKTHNTKFALSFFPKYIDFDKAIKKPKRHYDTLLLNYWIVEVPNNGIEWSRLFSNYEYEKNNIPNKRIKAKKNNGETKLLLTKKQKEERRKKKLDLSKEPVLHGEVIRRIKTDPEYAAKIKKIAKKNSEQKLNYTENLQAIERNKSSGFLNEEHQVPVKESVESSKDITSITSCLEQIKKNEHEDNNLIEIGANIKEAESQNGKQNMNFDKLIKVILSFLFFGALFKMPYSYYEIMRFLAMVGFVILGYVELKNKIYMLIWFSSALLVNPFLKLALGRTLWNVIDVIWILVLVFSLFHIKKD